MLPAWFRYTCFVAATLFLVFAALQYNDPDPARWIAIYTAVAAASIQLAKWPRYWALAAVVAAICAIWCGRLAAGVVGVVELPDLWREMAAKGGAIEQAREAGGLALASLWLATAATIVRAKLRVPR